MSIEGSLRQRIQRTTETMCYGLGIGGVGLTVNFLLPAVEEAPTWVRILRIIGPVLMVVGGYGSGVVKSLQTMNYEKQLNRLTDHP